MRKGKTMSWRYEKFKGNAAVYAICPKCNFYYSCGGLGKSVITCNYCPNCGSYENDDCENVNIIWNERDVEDFKRIVENHILNSVNVK